MPVTDLSTIYEETEVPEEKYAYVEYFQKKFKKLITTAFDDFTGS